MIRFATRKKREILNRILDKYSCVVNFFIGWFWEHPEIRMKNILTKEICDLAEDTWFTARMRQYADQEALLMEII